jgi:cyclopropane fatty-acyl-phospholipid synthase-like methyltransferase
MNMYSRAGIVDIKNFYKDKFASETRFDVFDDPLSWYDIKFAKYLWIYRNVKAGSRVLDFGCGSGSLAVLKRKGCQLTGIDYSEKALEIAANINGYDQIFCGTIFEFNSPKESFDYIVSLDVFGHIPFEEKDAVILELKQYLKPAGVMLHGIECGDVDYEAMSLERLRAFVEIDGHVGVENKKRTLDRFRRYFNHVEGEVRFGIENAAEDYIKQAQFYHAPIELEIINYLKHLQTAERRSFDIGNGLVQMRMAQMKLASPENLGGLLYLRASDVPLLEEDPGEAWRFQGTTGSIIYDSSVFGYGWYGVEKTNEMEVFRWSSGESYLRLGVSRKNVRITLVSFLPEILRKAQTVFFINEDSNDILAEVVLQNNQPVTIHLATRHVDELNVRIFVDVTCIPALCIPGSDDWRVLGICIKALEFHEASSPMLRSSIGND